LREDGSTADIGCVYTYATEPACNGTAGRLRLIQVLEVRIVGTPDPRYCKSLPLNTSFRCAAVPLKTGLMCTHVYIMFIYKGEVTQSTYRRRHSGGGMAPLILNLGSRRRLVVSLLYGCFFPGKYTRYPLKRRVLWNTSGVLEKNYLVFAGIRISDRPARSW
jgi:hypothetical protein